MEINFYILTKVHPLLSTPHPVSTFHFLSPLLYLSLLILTLHSLSSICPPLSSLLPPPSPILPPPPPSFTPCPLLHRVSLLCVLYDSGSYVSLLRILLPKDNYLASVCIYHLASDKQAHLRYFKYSFCINNY